MPGSLQHSPAEVIRQLIVDQGWGIDYVDDDTDWASFDSAEPNLPDNVITVYDTLGRDNGRDAFGERSEEQGFQVRIRSKTHPAGYVKSQEIAVGLDQIDHEDVTVDSTSYVVWAVMRTGNVLAIGHDAPNSKRRLFTLNGVVSLRLSSSGGMLLQDGSSLLLQDDDEILL